MYADDATKVIRLSTDTDETWQQKVKLLRRVRVEELDERSKNCWALPLPVCKEVVAGRARGRVCNGMIAQTVAPVGCGW